MAHKTTYEESRQKQPVAVINRTNAEEGARSKPRTSSVARDGHDNVGHPGFLVDTVQY
jgi:hypothetical protein